MKNYYSLVIEIFLVNLTSSRFSNFTRFQFQINSTVHSRIGLRDIKRVTTFTRRKKNWSSTTFSLLFLLRYVSKLYVLSQQTRKLIDSHENT